MNWTETETVVSICTGIVTCTQFFLWKHISKTKAYIEEKAKLLAQEEKIAVLTTIAERAKNTVTKEDIGEITLFAEKAKNTATKEDIEEITRKIEAVKSGFSAETEQLKSLLTIESKAKTQLIDKQRKALEDFWGKYNIWLTSFYGGWRTNNENIDLIQDLLNKADINNHACVMAFHNLSLYFDDTDFLENTRELVNNTLRKLSDIEQDIRYIQTINISEQKNGKGNPLERLSFLYDIELKNNNLQQDKDINKLIYEFIAKAKKYILIYNIKG